MDTDSGILVFVTGLDSDNKTDSFTLSGFDFGPTFGKSPPETLEHLSALTQHDKQFIQKPDLKKIHRWSAGWNWYVENLEKYPDPPFLLTDSPDVRLVFHGIIFVSPTSDALSLITEELSYHG